MRTLLDLPFSCARLAFLPDPAPDLKCAARSKAASSCASFRYHRSPFSAVGPCCLCCSHILRRFMFKSDGLYTVLKIVHVNSRRWGWSMGDRPTCSACPFCTLLM
jgi:hypothetical protein